MRSTLVAGVFALGTMTAAGVADAAADAGRPRASALRLSDEAVLARFTPEVRKDARLTGRALALWRTHFEAQAAELERQFARSEDWRPVLARAAVLIEEFLEASELPRAGHEPAGNGEVWVERLDPSTGRRVRELRPAPARPVIFAPGAAKDPGKQGAEKSGADVQERARKPGR
jgi:hypothetical protein